MEWDLRALGLVLFCAVVNLNVAGLAVDTLLVVHGWSPITEYARDNWWIRALIVGANMAGTGGLVVHFVKIP